MNWRVIMRVVCLSVAALFLCVACGPAASAWSAVVTVADFQDDFQGPTPAAGWSYLTNSGGAIGNSSNYAHLGWYAAGSQYNVDGSGPVPIGGNYVRLLGSGVGHPGPGTTQGEPTDRYAIAAYTVQSTDIAGYYPPASFELIDSSLSAGGGPITLEIYVNNTNIGSPINLAANTSTTFNVALGDLVAGDTIYVAVGPNVTHISDGFSNFDFTIQFTADPLPPIPEPSTALLLGLGLMGFSQIRRRKKSQAEGPKARG